MTRWATELNEHPFFNLLEQIQEKIETAIKKFPDNVEAVGELTRTQSVLTLAKKNFKSLTPELTPISILATLNTYLSKVNPLIDAYIANGNIVYLYEVRNPANANTINTHINNMLTSIIAYGKFAPQSNDIEIIVEEHNQYIDLFKKNATSFIEEKTKMEASLKKSFDNITDLGNSLFGIEGDEESIKNSKISKINRLLEHSVKSNESIQKYYTELFDDSNAESLKTRIQAFQINSKRDTEEINELLLASQKELKDLKSFHTDVYGLTDEDTEGEKKDGLKKDIEDSIRNLGVYEKTQQAAHKTLLDKANEMLSLTTTIGLSKAFNQLKGTFSKANGIWNFVFIISLLTMMAVAYNTMSLNFFGVEEIVTPVTSTEDTKHEWETILTKMLKGMPLYIPLVWLAVFATRRRSENKRLEQEYAHKEAVAITYDSYKEQIELIDDSKNKELLLKLLDKAIDTVAYNASSTLDQGKHTESTPSHDLVKEFSNAIKKITPENGN